MFSLRIVNADFYTAAPIPDLDMCHSILRESAVKKVPIIRIYGATPSGQKTCLHVHGVFPYIYIPYDGTQPTEKYVKQFATSVDFAVQVALGKASSSVQHVKEISVVKGIPYYGYHEGEREFLKISLYNPFLVTRIVSLLQNGAVMNKVFQPHEAHIPYLLQFFMDYNLYGMNLLYASSVRFRAPIRIIEGEIGNLRSEHLSPDPSPPKAYSTQTQLWNENTVPSDRILGFDVERLSICELEVDILASDILNKLEIGANIGTNPGLAAIWEDEQQRRREANENSQIASPPSQNRGVIPGTETERRFKERIREIIAERDMLIQSQMERRGREALSPEELSSYQDSILPLVASQKDLVPENQMDGDAVSQLLSQHIEDSPLPSSAQNSFQIIDEDEPMVNQSIVQDVVEASQRSFSQELSSSVDKEMVDILASLAEDADQPLSRKTPLSQSIMLDQGDAQSDEEAGDEEELSLDEESLLMSQKVWDDIEPRAAEPGDEKASNNENVNGTTEEADGYSQYNLEGLSDTWTGSLLLATIPQVDGAGDEESRDLESMHIPHGTSKKTRGQRSETFETTRKRWSSSDTTDESVSEDVWPQKGRIVRTYSKRQTSSLKLSRSPQLKDQSASVSAKNKKDDSEQCGSVDTFSLVLSESSESEDTGTSDKDFKSTACEVVSSQRAKTSDRIETKKGKTCSTTLRKRGKEEHGSYTAVITRCAHSPQRMSGQTKGTGDNDKHTFINRTTPRAESSKDLSNETRSRDLSAVSIQKDANLCKRTFALTDKKPLARSERMITRGTVRRMDALMSKDAVVRAMSDVSVPLDDVSSTSHLISKFAEAQVRLRKRKGISEGRRSTNSGSCRKGRSPKRSNEPLLEKSKTTTSPNKVISSRKKEERMNRYGPLTVVVKTSPKKKQTDEIQMQGERVDQSLGTEPCKHVDSVSLVSGTTPPESTADKKKRSGRAMERTTTQYPTLGSAPNERPKLGKQSCRNMSSDAIEASPQDRARDSDNEKMESNQVTDTTLHKKEAVKRKLELDVDKDLMSTSTLRSVVRKKRKTSLQLSLSLKRGSVHRADRLESSGATSTVGSVPKQDTLTPFDKQHNGDNNETNPQMSSDEESLDEVTCVPCSPIESEDSENLLRWSVHLEKVKDSFCLSPNAESDLLRLSAVSCDNDSKLNENASEQSSNKQHLPSEKETELLANALFNMSYPSPLPDRGQSSSPPSPSSPLDIAQDRADLKNTQSWFQRLDTSAPSEDVTLSDLESTRLLRFSESQVSSQETDSSDVDLHPKKRSRQLHVAPQLGETQTEIESTPIKVGAVRDMKMTRSELIEIEVPARGGKGSFEGREVIHEKVLSNNGKSFVVEKGSSTMEVSYTEGKDDVGSCLEKGEVSICEDVPRRKLEDHTEINDFRAALESCGSANGDEVRQVSGTPQMDRSSSMQTSYSNSSLVTCARQLVVESNEEDSVVQGLLLGEGRQRLRTSDGHPEFAHSALKIGATQSSQGRAQSSGDLDIGGLTSEGSSEKSGCKTKEDKPCLAQDTSPCLNLHSTDKSRFFDGNAVVVAPMKRPPSSQGLLSTLKDHGLPQCRYKEPFCSDPDDIPGYTGEVGGRYLRVESNQVVKLPEFESTNSFQGLRHWRLIMSASHESSFRALCQQTLDDASNVESNLELQIALMGDRDIVVTPARSPPAPKAVKAWARDKLSKQKKENRNLPVNYAGKLQERIREETAEQSEKKSSRENRVGVNVAETQKEKTGQTSKQIGEFVNLRGSDELYISVAPEKTTPVGLEATKKVGEKEPSDSAYVVETTSPCVLFSPKVEGVFTFGSEQQNLLKPSFVQGLDDRACNVSEQDEGLGHGTQPMNVELYEIETCSGQQGDALPGHNKAPAQAGVGTENNPPPRDDTLLQLPSSVAPLPMSPTLETQKSSLSPEASGSPPFAVYHSTPVATTSVYDVDSPICTPIVGAMKDKRSLSMNRGTIRMKHLGKDASSSQSPALRTQLLASQFKFVTPQPRHRMAWSSQIEGPSPNNTYGFKVTQMNLKDAKALHEVQHLTLFSLELLVRTRRDLRPDPVFDPICAIFYYIQTDTPLPSGKSRLTGIICVDAESCKLCQASRDSSLSNAGKNDKPFPCTESAASTSTSNISVLHSSDNAARVPHRPLLARSGVTAYDVEYVAEEKDLFDALIRLIHRWDPDILVGYEVQLFSWGFLLERALTLEIDLCSRLSRVKGSSSGSNMDAEKDLWGAAHTSEIKIAGRIILNVWRVMRHEVTLNSYTFENVAFHVLHERIPLYTFRTLSDWWDHRTALNRWRTVDHYVKRCRGNVRILESVDFIGRTSELARLFGILFFSVISRGSQYRVESMMLRIAKPMNYIAVSPSVEQRGAMRAPETIPLVMEPESRFYSDPVLVLDFQSLYPSMIIAYNYCFSTCLGRVSCLSEYGDFKFGATSLCIPPSLLKKLEDDIHVSPSGVAFVKPSVRKGVLPSMLSDILQTRIMVKNSMKKWKGDKALGRMLDARQLGLKLIANVTFGYTSAHFSGRMPCVEIGDSIVRKARETLERAIELVNNTPRWGARVVYGDTDSMFVLLKGVTKEQAFSIGQDIVQTVTALNPKPVKLKFEKVYLPCVLQTKKRYVGYMYETMDQNEPVFDAKGIETVRRDGCPAVAKILEKSLRILFDSRDLSLVKTFVQRQCTKLMQGRVSLQDFTFAKEYRGMKNYKPGACVPALELTRRFLREDRRSEPRVGERVPYVVVYGSPGLPLIQLVRRPQEVLQDPGLRLNASYYITKQILPPLNRVFSLIGINVFLWYAELPRVVRVVQRISEHAERKKGTISQYFVTMTCPVCQELTSTDLCSSCRARPQHSTVVLANRVRGWERTYQHLAEICYNCCGSRDPKLRCVSLDCPVFHKLVHTTRDINSSLHLRRILDSF